MKNKSNLYLLLAMVVGAIMGLFPTKPTLLVANSIAELFLNFLRLISLPVIFLSIVTTITNMNSLDEAKILVKKILKYTLLTTFLAATVGLFLYYFIKPGSQALTLSDATLPAEKVSHKGGYLTFLLQIIPSNAIEAFRQNNVLGVAFISTVLSIGILKIPKEQGEPIKLFFSGLFSALLKISSGVIKLLPLGVFAFTMQLTHSLQGDATYLKPILFYSICVVSANLIQGLIVLPIMLRLKGVKAKDLIKNMGPAISLAFFSKSSNAALPLTLECANTRAKFSKSVYSFSFPLCSVINMNGCAAFILITYLFVSGISGASPTFIEMVPWVFIASISAIGNAGVPMGCYFLTSALLIGSGYPIQIMGLILPLYSVFDMIETALNVWSDCCVTAVVDKEIKERKKVTSSKEFSQNALLSESS